MATVFALISRATEGFFGHVAGGSCSPAGTLSLMENAAELVLSVPLQQLVWNRRENKPPVSQKSVTPPVPVNPAEVCPVPKRVMLSTVAFTQRIHRKSLLRGGKWRCTAAASLGAQRAEITQIPSIRLRLS